CCATRWCRERRSRAGSGRRKSNATWLSTFPDVRRIARGCGRCSCSPCGWSVSGCRFEPAAAMNARRILVVSSMHPPATAIYLVEALRDIGHEVRVVSDRAHPTVSSLANGVFDARRWVEREGFRPDMLLFVEGGT